MKQWSKDLRPNVQAAMKGIGQAIKEHLPPGVGFALLMFDLGEGGFMNYLSSADRGDMVKAMKELIEVLEGQR